MKTPRQEIEGVLEKMVGSEPLKPTMWLRNTYGLDDDGTLNAGQIEEMLESYDADIRSRFPEAVEGVVGVITDYVKSIPHATRDEAHNEKVICEYDIIRGLGDITGNEK